MKPTRTPNALVLAAARRVFALRLSSPDLSCAEIARRTGVPYSRAYRYLAGHSKVVSALGR